MMPSSPFCAGCAPDLKLRFRFCPRLASAVIIIHVLVATLLWHLLAPFAAAGLTAGLGVSLFRCGRLPGVGFSSRTLVLARAHDDGTWTLTDCDGRMLPARLEKGLMLSSSFIFLRWVTPDIHRYEAVLLGKSSASDALRRLRAGLCQLGDSELGETRPGKHKTRRRS